MTLEINVTKNSCLLISSTLIFKWNIKYRTFETNISRDQPSKVQFNKYIMNTNFGSLHFRIKYYTHNKTPINNSPCPQY